MVSTEVTLAEVGAPHLGIFVGNDRGLVRVFLDDGASEVVDPVPRAIPLGATASLHVEGARYVIQRADTRVVVHSVGAGDPIVSPDGHRFATVEEIAGRGAKPGAAAQQIVVIDVADAAVRRFPVPTPGPPPWPWLSIRWTKQGDAILLAYQGHFRLDLATGKMIGISALDYETDQASSSIECPARGLRLETRSRDSRQELVVVPFGGTADPERVASLEPRVVVSATDHPSPYGGDGAVNLGRPRPGPLSGEAFTPACEHVVFSLEGRIYVANLATGRFAFLMRGRSHGLP